MAKVDPKARKAEREENGYDENGGAPRLAQITENCTVEAAAVCGFERFKSAKKGTPGLMFRFVALNGPYAGKVVDRNYWLSDAAIQQLADLALARGYEEPFDADDDDAVERATMGKPVEIKVKAGSYTKTDGTVVRTGEVAYTNKCKVKAKKEEVADWKARLAAGQADFQHYLDWRETHPRGEGGGSSGEGRSDGGGSSGGGGSDEDIPF